MHTKIAVYVYSCRWGENNENDVTMTIAGLWTYGDWRHVDYTFLPYRTQFLAPSVTFCLFLFVSQISGTAERICAKIHREEVIGNWLGRV